MTARFTDLKLRLHLDPYCIVRFQPNNVDPRVLDANRYRGNFSSVTRTKSEVSLIVEQLQPNLDLVKDAAAIEQGWRLLQIEGQLEFEVVGIIATFSSWMAAENIPIFSLSTYYTDYFLIKSEHLETALLILKRNKIQIDQSNA